METLFKKTVNKSVVIKGIERVQNPFMWEKYQRYFILTNNDAMPGLILYNNTIPILPAPAMEGISSKEKMCFHA